MANTINDKLNQLRLIKADIRNAINSVAGTTMVPENACFDTYSDYIRQLCKCQPTTYSITFNTNGGSGSVPAKTGIQGGSTISLPAYTGTKTGYTQIHGWATTNSATSALYAEGQSITVNNNITLYAVWSKNSYTLSWIQPEHGELKVTIGGVVQTGTSASVPYGTPVRFECTATPGYGFSNWLGTGIPSGTMTTNSVMTFNMPAGNVTEVTAALAQSAVTTLAINGAFKNNTVLEKYLPTAVSVQSSTTGTTTNKVENPVNTNGYTLLVPSGNTLKEFSWIDAANNEVPLNVVNYDPSLTFSKVITKGLPKSVNEPNVEDTISVNGKKYTIYNAYISVTPSFVKYKIK